eukprot:1943714-Amphidinium_carterae.1
MKNRVNSERDPQRPSQTRIRYLTRSTKGSFHEIVVRFWYHCVFQGFGSQRQIPHFDLSAFCPCGQRRVYERGVLGKLACPARLRNGELPAATMQAYPDACQIVLAMTSQEHAKQQENEAQREEL